MNTKNQFLTKVISWAIGLMDDPLRSRLLIALRSATDLPIPPEVRRAAQVSPSWPR